jgi:hypothetical protein
MKHPNARKRAQRSSRKSFKVIVEKHPDGYVAYPLGLSGRRAVRCTTCRKVFRTEPRRDPAAAKKWPGLAMR